MAPVVEGIDQYPTHCSAGRQVRVGIFTIPGACLVPGGVNFCVSVPDAYACSVVLFEPGNPHSVAEIPFLDPFRIGGVYAMIVLGLDPEAFEYGYRVYGPYEPARGFRFDPSKILLDPFAKLVRGRDVWGAPPDRLATNPYRGAIPRQDFDWESDRPLEIPLEDLVIYEMHVRGFSQHPSAGVMHPGTFAGVVEKIPYLKQLGVNCVELMPVFEFDEFTNSRTDPHTGRWLGNYWGYSTVNFFAPKAGYAATGRHGLQADELKNMVKELHRHGIEVMLDVVFNHTAEGDERGPSISFRGLDNRTFYMLTSGGHYFNFSGCGNTVNCNHPQVQAFILDCLCYWAAEYHVDGFRFDLASIMSRDAWGCPLADPPLVLALAQHPLLKKCKLIAEAWDAGGLYQVGSFPSYGRWSEWNGQYRDRTRKFIKGDLGMVGAAAQCLTGSKDLYGTWGRPPTTSINFVTCHDGFTLHDLFSYNGKHNEANGEGNRDGADDNHSWNCGWEGPAEDPGVLELRRRMMKNAMLFLLVSHGVPMLLMGDEVGRSQGGNNNAYCHDSAISWMDWRMTDAAREQFEFTRKCIAFRHAHPVLRPSNFREGHHCPRSGRPAVSWHGTRSWDADWSPGSRVLACMLSGDAVKSEADDDIYIGMNMYWHPLQFEVPSPRAGRHWRWFANTSMPTPLDCAEPGEERPLDSPSRILIGGRSIVVLVGTAA